MPSKTATAESICGVVNRDILRTARTLPGQRPGQPVADGRECVVYVPVSNELWHVVYGLEPPSEPHTSVVAKLRFHGGKQAWELVEWYAGRPVTTSVNGREVITGHDRLTETAYGPWGVGVLKWKEVREA